MNRWPLPLALSALVLLALAERTLAGLPRLIAAAMGLGALLAAVGLAVIRWWRADAERRAAYGSVMTDYALMVVAIAIAGLGIQELDLLPSGQPTAMVAVLWPVTLLLGLLPAIAKELAIAGMARTPRLETWRVALASRAARIVAFAIVGFAGLNYAASAWEREIDLSYFKTTQPGQSTLAIVSGLSEPVRMVLFFPPGNAVAEQVRGYAEALAQASAQLQVQLVDQALRPALARELAVRANGYLALSRGEMHETLHIGLDLDGARSKLKDLDAQVQQRLLKVIRPPRVAYLTSGHLERDQSPTADDTRLGLGDFRQLLEGLGFKVQRLGLGEGLGDTVPDDATVVIVAGPLEPLLPSERQALSAYANRGGSLLLALDPDRGPTEDPLLSNFGIEVGRELVAHDRFLVRMEGRGESPYDLVTTRTSQHPTVQTLGRALGRMGVVLLGAGEVRKTNPPNPSLSTTFMLRGMTESWLDANGNGKFDKDSEERVAPNLGAAIEKKDNADGMRVVVFGDVDLLGTGVVRNPGNAYLVRDTLRWLAHDEESAGLVESEQDIPIVHRKESDAVWFYGSSFFFPALVLFGGLFYVHRSAGRGRRG